MTWLKLGVWGRGRFVYSRTPGNIKIDKFEICNKVNSGMALVLSIVNNINGAT